MSANAWRVPGPPELLPGRPDATVDLQTREGAALLGARWRYHDASVHRIRSVAVGEDLGPSGPPISTYDIAPRAQDPGFDDSTWCELDPVATQQRMASGRVCFSWYRLAVTIPERVGGLDATGSTVVFEVVIDDYAEVWVDGRLPLHLGAAGGQVVSGFNVPNRVVLTQDARPGETFSLAVFGMNGPVSASPRNYIWVRSASVDFYARDRARPARDANLTVLRHNRGLDAVLGNEVCLEQVATGFDFTEGPVWTPDGALLFSSPNTNTIYRWDPLGRVEVYRTKSGYSGPDIGRFTQPGSNGLAFDADGRLTICQHGNRRVLRVEPHGNVTVLADRYDGARLNSPNDLVYGADGALWFTDPPFGLPGQFDDPAKELPFSGVFRVRDGRVHLASDELRGPNGVAVSPDGGHLYVGNWDRSEKVVMRWALDEAGEASAPAVFFDQSDVPGDAGFDGLAVDSAGTLFACGPKGVEVVAPDGTHLGTLALPEDAHNLAWGDVDARTLYVTAMTSVYRLRTLIPGVRN